MADPISPTAATLAASSVTAVPLVIAGVSLGLQVDVLIAGLAGAVAAIVLLDSVPRTNDSWRELLRSTGKRVSVAVVSAAVAGYLSPVAAAILGGVLPATAADPLGRATALACALILGGGAQRFLKALVDRGARKIEEA